MHIKAMKGRGTKPSRDLISWPRNKTEGCLTVSFDHNMAYQLRLIFRTISGVSFEGIQKFNARLLRTFFSCWAIYYFFLHSSDSAKHHTLLSRSCSAPPIFEARKLICTAQFPDSRGSQRKEGGSNNSFSDKFHINYLEIKYWLGTRYAFP